MTPDHRAKYQTHPLSRLFQARRFTTTEGLNWLQDRGLISDLCVTLEDVAEVDVQRVLELAARSNPTA